MERYVRAELGLTNDDEDEEPVVIEDLPLYHPLPYVIQTWSAWRQHGVLPESGGMNDQMMTWGHDRMQMDTLYASVLERVLPELDRRFRKDEDTAEAPGTWEDLING